MRLRRWRILFSRLQVNRAPVAVVQMLESCSRVVKRVIEKGGSDPTSGKESRSTGNLKCSLKFVLKLAWSPRTHALQLCSSALLSVLLLYENVLQTSTRKRGQRKGRAKGRGSDENKRIT